jgi:integrase
MEAAMRFTDRSVEALKPKEKRYVVWESNGKGLGIRVGGQKKSWIFSYWNNCKKRWMTLGDYPQMSLADAHIAHGKAGKLLEQGIDPGNVEQHEKLLAKREPTMEALCQRYLEEYSKPNKRTWQEDERIINKDLIPEWGSQKVREITRKDIRELLATIKVERNAPVAANRTLSLISKIFAFAVEEDIVAGSPCVGMKPPAIEKQRDRALSEKEIKAFWFGLDNARMFPLTKLVLKLMVITGQRKGEVMAAKWSHIDLDSGWWTIPSENSKNRLSHRVPLSSMALDILGELKAISGQSEWVFPSQTGKGHLTERAVNRALDRNAEVIGVADFHPHDLRRSMASHLTGMGIPRLTVSKLLNHVESGITAVYDRHGYDDEKRMALDAWSRKLEAIINGATDTKVIPFKRQSAV